jgi:hypothetical protein
MRKPRRISRRNALRLGGSLLAASSLPAWGASTLRTTVYVGDPNHPSTLALELSNAHGKRARDITIRAGIYVLPANGRNSVELVGWSNVVLRCEGVTIVFQESKHRPILLRDCKNVTIEGAKLQFATVAYTQGRIKATSEDGAGPYIDWQIDAGYTSAVDPRKATFNVIDRSTRLLKVGTGDFDAIDSIAIGPGRFRLRRINGLTGSASVDDWLVCRAEGGESIIQLDNCKGCVMSRIVLKNSGFAAFFETGGDGGHCYVDCSITRGPLPEGATEEQLISCGADGFHSTGTRVGPTIERCVWDGVLLDDCIAIHGSLQKVLYADGNKIILEQGNGAGFAVNEPVRISSSDGFLGQANCIRMRLLDAPQHSLELTLDKVLAVPANAKAGNPDRCGRFYKVLDCTLGNTRSRGILVKADDGLIQGCIIEGCGMSAISIGPEYYWGEANYSWNVTVAHNILRHNALRNTATPESQPDISQGADGVIFVHGDGAIGNRNINITGNIFDQNYCPYMMNIAWADTVRITDNILDVPSPLRLSNPGHIVSLHDARNITLKGNTYTNPGPSVDHPVFVGKNVEGLAGNDQSGMREFRK